jgi:hypothetical protein
MKRIPRRASDRPKKATGKSERRIRLSTIPSELRSALIFDIDMVLRKAHREKQNPADLRESLVTTIRRFVQQHGLASVGYRFESSLSLDSQPVDAVMFVVRSAYVEGVLVYADELAARIADDLADQHAL